MISLSIQLIRPALCFTSLLCCLPFSAIGPSPVGEEERAQTLSTLEDSGPSFHVPMHCSSMQMSTMSPLSFEAAHLSELAFLLLDI